MDQLIKIGYWLRSIIAPSNQDIKVVVLSVLGATIIWVLSALNKTYTSVITCPIVLEYARENTIQVKPPPEFVEANVTGVGWDLLKQSISFNKEPLMITLDNPVETKQIAGYTIQPLLSQHLGSLNLNFIVTDSLSFNIQPKISKKINLKVDQATLDLENLFEIIGPIQLIPDTARFTGPKTMLDTLSDTLYLKLPFENVDDDVDQTVAVNPFNQNLISSDPPEIQIRFDVSRMISFRQSFSIEPVNFPEDSSVMIVPDQVVLNFRIQAEFIDIFPETDFIITADYDDINKKDSTVSIKLVETPFYVDDVTMDTTTIKVVYAK
ncbi:MAG: hypothetical protein KFF73_02585 [Cyclobacteriaceae bacterium]|nr:hypothetical protein [Cyclobacteriaceae bacterium]